MPAPRSSLRLTRVAAPSENGGPTVLTLRQSALRAPDASRLRAELVALHQPGHPARIVLSLRGLTVLASPCIATLAEVTASLDRVGGSLILCDLPPDVARMFRRTGLARTLRLARSTDHARRLLGRQKAMNRAA